jgi:chromosome segregation ATPase
MQNKTMCALTKVQTQGSQEVDPAVFTHFSDLQLESVLRDIDQANLVAPLREVKTQPGGVARFKNEPKEKRQAALALQEQWNSWLSERDRLRDEIRRGREALEQIERKAASLRASLEDWAAYEKTCGKNPLIDYAESMLATEQLMKFLPLWLKAREARLREVAADLEACASQNGLEHML